MNNGVDSGSAIAETDEPKELNNQLGQGEWFSSLSLFCAQNPSRNRSGNRIHRRYKVIRHRDGVATIQTDVATITANKLRARYRKEGYTVDLIEESSLTGDVIPVQAPSGNIPCPNPYRTNSQRSKNQVLANKLASWRANRLSQNNAKMNAKRDQNKSFVYDKTSGLLVFSGDVEGAINYIIKRMENGIWGMGDWVIYLPVKIWEMLGSCANG